MYACMRARFSAWARTIRARMVATSGGASSNAAANVGSIIASRAMTTIMRIGSCFLARTANSGLCDTSLDSVQLEADKRHLEGYLVGFFLGGYPGQRPRIDRFPINREDHAGGTLPGVLRRLHVSPDFQLVSEPLVQQHPMHGMHDL